MSKHHCEHRWHVVQYVLHNCIPDSHRKTDYGSVVDVNVDVNVAMDVGRCSSDDYTGLTRPPISSYSSILINTSLVEFSKNGEERLWYRPGGP
jgi:hypothetical protein